MAIDRPEPGAEIHQGKPTVPRVAATVLLLRGEQSLEVLMVQRNPSARFMGGAWVFPGGAVESADGAGEEAVRAAAVRELQEEAGIELASPDLLVPYGRWITPKEIKTRFDTWFFLAPAPRDAVVTLDQTEVVDHRWITPADALSARERGEMLLVFPTIKNLQSLTGFSSSAVALSAAAERRVHPVEPRVVGAGDEAHVTIPGDPDYPAS